MSDMDDQRWNLVYPTKIDSCATNSIFGDWPLYMLTYIHTYIIDHYNPSVRIIDLVSHTTYVVCVNFIHKWRDLQFKDDSERQICF